MGREREGGEHMCGGEAEYMLLLCLLQELNTT